MIKKIILLVCLAALLFSFTSEKAEAHPHWWGPPWAWGFYEVHYYHWYPYYPTYYVYYNWEPYYVWYPWWYDEYYYYYYWEPDFYCCYYSPKWYVGIWFSWGWHPYYWYNPYWYYYPPYYYGYYAYYDYQYPDYYWDGYGRWRDNYYDGHKPYRTNGYGGGGKNYAYHNWKEQTRPPKDYGKGKNWAKVGKAERSDHNIEIVRVDPVKSIRSAKRYSKGSIKPSVSESPLNSYTKKKIDETDFYKTEEVIEDHHIDVSERKFSRSSDVKNNDKKQAEKKTFAIKRSSKKARKEENSDGYERRKVSGKKGTSKKKVSLGDKNYSSSSRFSAPRKTNFSSRTRARKAPSRRSRKGIRR